MMCFGSHFIFFYLVKINSRPFLIVHPGIVRNISSILPLDSLQPVTNTERNFIMLEEKNMFMC